MEFVMEYLHYLFFFSSEQTSNSSHKREKGGILLFCQIVSATKEHRFG